MQICVRFKNSSKCVCLQERLARIHQEVVEEEVRQRQETALKKEQIEQAEQKRNEPVNDSRLVSHSRASSAKLGQLCTLINFNQGLENNIRKIMNVIGACQILCLHHFGFKLLLVNNQTRNISSFTN